MTVGEGWNIDALVNQELCLLAQLPLNLNGLVQHLHLTLTLHFTFIHAKDLCGT